MENFTAFLESSTIHGLSYIAAGRKYVRLFWILVVIGGFTGAGGTISQKMYNGHKQTLVGIDRRQQPQSVTEQCPIVV